jgi:hypothetical protein
MTVKADGSYSYRSALKGQYKHSWPSVSLTNVRINTMSIISHGMKYTSGEDSDITSVYFYPMTRVMGIQWTLLKRGFDYTRENKC